MRFFDQSILWNFEKIYFDLFYRKSYLVSGLYYKHIHGQMSGIFHARFFAVKNVRNLREKISTASMLHSQTSVNTDIPP